MLIPSRLLWSPEVLKQHLLPNVICSEVIQGRAKSRNVLSNVLNLTRTEDGKVFVDDAQVIRADVMATNGVMHIVDAVLVPDDGGLELHGFFSVFGLAFPGGRVVWLVGLVVGWVVWVAGPNGIWRMAAVCVRSRVNVL